MKYDEKLGVVHWYKNDYGRTVMLLIGGPGSIKRRLSCLLRKSPNMLKPVSEVLDTISVDFNYENSELDRCGRQAYNRNICTAVMWFPVVPKDSTLVHEIVHCVQGIMGDMGIEDDEFEAYTVDYLFDYFQGVLSSDKKVRKLDEGNR